MEANEALAAIERHFPPESGLYKKGLRAQERVALLYFDFPLAQAKAASPAIAAYEEETGWKAEPNAECRPAQAESLIAKLVRDDSGGEAFLAKSPSYYREEGSFIATVEGSLRSPQEVKRAFFEKTGMRLLFPEDGKPKPAQKKAARSARAMEQNQALAAVDAHFAGLPHRPYKKGLKTRGQETGIELSFATEALGRRYQEDMDSLMAETGWSIWLNASPNQHELLREAQDCLAQEGLSAKKVSFMPDTGSVKAVLASAASPASQSAASDAFKEKTGGTLLFS
jgi:hypothetical protein